MSNRNHPIRQLFDYASSGHAPTAKELDEIVDRAGNYPGATLRRELKDAVTKVVEVRQGGENGRARQMAREYAAEIISKVGELEAAERDLPEDPRGLAAIVRGERVADGEDDPRALGRGDSPDPQSPRKLAEQISRDKF